MDNKNMDWRQTCRPSTRRLIQLYSALLHNAHLRGFIDGEIYQGKTKYACVPGFNCYSCPGAVGACPLGALQNALAAAGHRAGWYMLGILLLFGTILGRTICGWICPLGLIQELMHKLPTFKIRKSRVTRLLSYLKYVVLAVFVIAIPLYYGLTHDIPVPGFCKYICPAGTLEGAVGLLSNPANSGLFGMLDIYFTRKFVIMVIIGLSCIFCYRSFCRFLCPLGAIYGLFNRFCLTGVKVDTEKCNGCGACVRSCGMDVKRVGDHECIHCAQCMDCCPKKAISLKAGNVTLKAPADSTPEGTGEASDKGKKAGRTAWAIAIAVLCFALLWFNFLDPSLKTAKKPVSQSTQAAAPENTVSEGASGAEEEAPDAVGAAEMTPDDGMEETSPAGEAEEALDAAGAAEMTPDDGAEETSPAGEAKEAPDAAEQEEEENFESNAPVGYDPGMQLEDFSIECLDGSEFHLADTRGKVTFINLWATYCGPCVKELPHFNEFYHEHEGDVEILAVHSSIVVDEPADYLADKGWTIPFAVDTDDDMVWEIVNGSSTLPQTIVLNRYGEVIFNQKGSVTPEMLEALYKQAAENH